MNKKHTVKLTKDERTTILITPTKEKTPKPSETATTYYHSQTPQQKKT
ncbi:MAG: hypothetical protein LBE76_09340 [Nitrososphaerota archaeon]|jgi:hypothetical protein|nr:hypothetical protein [Nitrososphaerota archaeon]